MSNKSFLSLTILISLLLWSAKSYTQEKSERFLALGSNYGLDIPIGQLADRFGSSFHAAISLDLYSPKLKGFMGLEAEFQFGEKIKEDALNSIRAESGAILGTDGRTADVFLRRNGAYLGVYINKTLLSIGKTQMSGLNAGLGVGIWSHNIRFRDQSGTATQLTGDYYKGYDRLTRGPTIKETLSYLHLSSKLNWSIGLAFMQGFTKSVRAIDFDTRNKPTGTRLDLSLSLEAKWLLPLTRLTRTQEEIFY